MKEEPVFITIEKGKEIRCSMLRADGKPCNKKFGEADIKDGKLAIKCPRCKNIVKFRWLG